MTINRILRFSLTLILSVTQTSLLMPQPLLAQDKKADPVLQSVNDADIQARLEKIEKAVDERRIALGIPGVSLAIIKNDKVVFLKGFGERDAEKHLPVTPDTIFAIGSSTKAFTSMLAAMSADDGKLSFDDSPKKFIPYFKLRDPEADSQVTLRDLLSHRTGLGATDLSWVTGVLSREEIIRVAGAAKPSAPFRQKFQYQNVMYMTGGEMIAQANRKSWESLISKRILQPLGMKATNLSIQEMQKSKDFSKGYQYDAATKKPINLKFVDLREIAPAGAINSNARDMAQWVRLMLGGGAFAGKRLVSEKNFNELITPKIQLGPNVSYGLGWVLGIWRKHPVIFHGGNIDGFNAMVAMMPDQKIGLVMLSNVSDSPLKEDVKSIVWENLVEKSEVKNEAVTTAESFAVEPQSEAGNYKLAATGLLIKVGFKEGKLTIQAPNQPESVLQSVSGRRYRLAAPAPEGYFVTFRQAKNNANETEMVLEQPEGIAVLSRISLKSDTNDNSISENKNSNLPAIEEIMTKMIAAAGGEENLRKHRSIIIRESAEIENQGIQAELIRFAAAPNKLATRTTYMALNKRIGTMLEYFDGANGGTEASFGTAQTKTGKELANARLAADFYQLLNWKTLFKTVEVQRRAKISDEDVFIVVKTPPEGTPVTEFVSANTFLVVRRDTAVPVSGTSIFIPSVEYLSDYRETGGIMIPYKIMNGNPIEGETAITVKEVKFDENIPAEVFQSGSQMKSLPAAKASDVASIDSIVAALYDVISGDAGKKRDWDRLRSLFVTEGRMIPVSPTREGGFAAHFLSPDDYVARSGNYVETNGFFESEISRKTEQFGNIAHVFSTYEGRHKQSDEKPFLRGINSIQLMFDGKRWWIVDIFWDSERPDNPLPRKYIQR